MKTEQEQVEEIVKILLEASKKCLDTDCDCCVDQYEKECAQYRKAVALVRAGYCYLFKRIISCGHRCDECKQAEVKDEHSSN